MSFTLDNFVRSILAVDAAIGDTSLVVALVAPPLRDPPAASAGAPGILILQDQPTAPTKIEIVTYTGVSIVGTQVTLSGVTRGLEGTAAQAWTAGTQTFSGSTAAVLAQFALKAALSAVATSGEFADLIGKPTTLSGYGITDAATDTQGAAADSALQPGDVGSAAFASVAAFATATQGAKADSAVQPNTAINALSGTNTGDQDLSGLIPKAGGVSAGPFVVKADGSTNTALSFQNAAGALQAQVGSPEAAARLCAQGQIGDIVLRFVATNGVLRIADITGNQAVAFSPTGQFWRMPANGGSVVAQPRIFVQSGDPGAGAADGDLWVF